MPLIKDGRIVSDPWTRPSDEVAIPEFGPVIVSLARWQRERDALIARDDPVGVQLKSNELASEIGADVAHLALVVIEFPSFRDGRPYSSARLLRERYGFSGELRAVGNVLRDQFRFMHRCGFDAFEVKDEQAVAGWAAAMAEFSVFYQPASDGIQSVARLRQRRRAAE
jgi:uncharacterized protein (DUF934 family)